MPQFLYLYYYLFLYYCFHFDFRYVSTFVINVFFIGHYVSEFIDRREEGE